MRIVVVAIVSVLTVGCSSYHRSYSNPTPVRGRVILANGQPVNSGRVVLYAEVLSHTPEVSGELDTNGRFVLSTFAKGDGAIPGKYKVVIDPTSYKSGSPKTNRNVPKKFTDATTTDLHIDVNQGENVVDLILK